jgi:hypothetical protein
MYEKHYAVVTHVTPKTITVAPGVKGQRETVLRLNWRCGWGHIGCRGFDFPRGTVVKVYQRPQDSHLKFRRQGS